MYSTHKAKLDNPQLQASARHIYIVPNLTAHTLLLIGQLCDVGCKVAFTANDVTVAHEGATVLTGKRTPTTCLWQFNMPPAMATPNKQTPEHVALAAIGSATPAKLVALAHATLFSPALSTLQTALQKGYLTNFPGLTDPLLRKHPLQSIAMVKGHLDQTRMNYASTKQPLSDPATEDEPFPSTTTNECCHHCYMAIMEPTGQIYTDQTRKFVQPSSSGNIYLLTLYDYDSNSILAEPLPTQSGTLAKPSLLPVKASTKNYAVLVYGSNSNALTMNALTR